MLRQLVGICCLLIAMPFAAAAKDDTPPITLGETTHIALDKGDTQDWVVTLSPGDYDIVLDAKRTDGDYTNIQANIALLKNNGVILDPNLLTCNEIGIATRVGKAFHVAKLFKARLRMTHSQTIPTDYWVTLLPASKMAFLPFGYGGDILDAAIGEDNGVGGDIAPHASVYYKITLPPGRWSISLGLKLPKDANTNLQGQVDLLDRYGLPDHEDFVDVNEIGDEARKETVLTVIKPKPILLHVINTNTSLAYHYDLTIEKATD